jgi:hypothetical protein
MLYVIVDLDGTLSDDTHRAHLAHEKRWDEYHIAGKDDLPNLDVAMLLKTYTKMEHIVTVVLTGRTEDYQGPTVKKWLTDHHLMVDHLLMRPSGDFRPANEVKWSLLEVFFGDEKFMRASILCMLDNDERGVAFWRGKGMRVWQVR